MQQEQWTSASLFWTKIMMIFQELILQEFAWEA